MTETKTIPEALTSAVRDHVAADKETIKSQLATMISYPSVHGTEETQQACADTAQAVADMFAEVGVELQQHHTVDGSISLTGTIEGTNPEADDHRTVLLYSHYDVQPAGDLEAWESDPWTLEERDGRYYGRGAADCKGNVAMHLAALRALNSLRESGTVDKLPTIKILVEGSEERGSAGLSNLLKTQPELFQADVILIADVGNAAVGQPTLVTTLRGSADLDVTVSTLKRPVHSGMFGGAAPDALAALIRILDSLRDDTGTTVVDGLDCSQRWTGLPYDDATFRSDAAVLDGVELLSEAEGAEASVADLTWARPALTVTGIDCPPATNAINAIPATAMAHLNLRVPAGIDPVEAQDALEAHVKAHAPWNVQVDIKRDDVAHPFGANVEGAVVQHVAASLAAAYGKETVSMGEGASIPLCAELLEAVPGADIALYGVEEPLCAIHSPNESVDAGEIRDIAVAEALFLATIL